MVPASHRRLKERDGEKWRDGEQQRQTPPVDRESGFGQTENEGEKKQGRVACVSYERAGRSLLEDNGALGREQEDDAEHGREGRVDGGKEQGT